MFNELNLLALIAFLLIGALGFWLRWVSPLAGVVLLALLVLIGLFLWIYIRMYGPGWDTLGHQLLLWYVLAPGLAGAMLAFAAAWWLKARG